MGTAPRTPSQPPLRQAPVLTLIGASRTLMGDGARWEGGGVGFQPLPCDPTFTPFAHDCDEVDTEVDVTQGEVRFDPFTLWASTQCSPLSWDIEEGARRARALLDIDQYRQLEREFWTGEVVRAETPDLPNLYLAMDGTVDELEGGTAMGLSEALTRLQQEIADSGVGRGMIHATVRTAGLWSSLGLLRRTGALLVDIFDNVVVPGVGYPGNGPGQNPDTSGDTAWAYVTGIVDTRLGEVFVPESPAGVVRRSANTIEVIAQRPAMAVWDGCLHAGINVDHATSGVSGAGGSGEGGDVDGGSP